MLKISFVKRLKSNESSPKVCISFFELPYSNTSKARKKKASKKAKTQGFEGNSGLTDFDFMMQTKSTFRETSKADLLPFKIKNPRGFRPDTLNSATQLDGDDKIKSLNSMFFC